MVTSTASVAAPAEAHCAVSEMATGKVTWEEKSFGGFGALQAIGQKLLIISNQGELVVAESNPDEFTEISRAQVTGPKCWTTPVLSNGRVYCETPAATSYAST